MNFESLLQIVGIALLVDERAVKELVGSESRVDEPALARDPDVVLFEDAAVEFDPVSLVGQRGALGGLSHSTTMKVALLPNGLRVLVQQMAGLVHLAREELSVVEVLGRLVVLVDLLNQR